MSSQRMPRSVIVGPHTYKVRRVKARGMNGDCKFDELQIQVHPGLKPDKAQEILLHEVLHACTYPRLNKDEVRSDEEFVEGIAPMLLQVMQDNPQLVAYLTAK